MKDIEHPFFTHIAKCEDLKKVAVSWQELFEASQKSEKKLSIDEAREEGHERYSQAVSLLKSMSKSELVRMAADFLFDLSRQEWNNKSLRSQASLTVKQRELIRQRLNAMKITASQRGTKAAEILHGRPGGSRSKAAEIRSLWASGKYSSRDICAEQECGALELSFSTARKALRGTPDPA